MSEITTCEQYVITRLLALEDRYDEQTETINHLYTQIDRLNDIVSRQRRTIESLGGVSDDEQ